MSPSIHWGTWDITNAEKQDGTDIENGTTGRNWIQGIYFTISTTSGHIIISKWSCVFQQNVLGIFLLGEISQGTESLCPPPARGSKVGSTPSGHFGKGPPDDCQILPQFCEGHQPYDVHHGRHSRVTRLCYLTTLLCKGRIMKRQGWSPGAQWDDSCQSGWGLSPPRPASVGAVMVK